MIRHACPSCEEVLRSSPRLAGLPIRCPRCRFELVVPPDAEREPRPGGFPVWVIGLAVLVGLAIVANSFWVVRGSRAGIPASRASATPYIRSGPSQPTKMVFGNGDLVCLEVPSRWAKEAPPSSQRGALTVSNPEGSAAVVVFTRDKREVRDVEPRPSYAARLARNLAGSERHGEITDGPRELIIKGLPATRYEVHYTSTTSGRRKAVLLTVIEGQDRLYAVLASCSVVDIPQQRPALQRVVASFREEF